MFRRFPPLVSAITCAVLLSLGAMDLVRGQAPAQGALTILSREGRRALPLTVANDQEAVFLDDLATAFQLNLREDSLGAITVGYKGRSVLLTPDQPVVSIGGRLVSLPSAPLRSGRRVLVPVEFVNRALALIYDSRLELRKASRLLIHGDLRVPRVTVRFDSGDPARLVVDATPRSTATVSQDNAILTIRFDADALDLVPLAIAPHPIVQGVRTLDALTLAVDLGPRFGGFRASTQSSETTMRLTVDLIAAASTAAPAAAVAPPAAPASAPPPPPDLSALGLTGGLRTIAIDPGHGGEDEGVKGTAGTKEKDLVLAVARRLKVAIEGRLGIRVLLTREDDRNVGLDGRAALANNNKADLFLSLHANASFRKAATGASILYAAFDREEERAGTATLGSDRLPTFAGTMRDVDLVVWDLAQIRHVARSGEMAKILEEQFRDRVPLSPHPVDRLPLDVLEAANMPAVLVEMGYLTNGEQETQMNGAEFQGTLVQAIFDAVLKFRDTLGAATK